MRRTPSYKTCELVYYLFGSDSCVTFTAPLAFSKPSWQHIAGTQMTRSATEQSVAVMDVMGTQGMLQSNSWKYMLSPPLEIHVEFNNGMWWACRMTSLMAYCSNGAMAHNKFHSYGIGKLLARDHINQTARTLPSIDTLSISTQCTSAT